MVNILDLEHESFDFLGYRFRPGLSKNKYGKTFVGFTPAISNNAANRIRKEIRPFLHLHEGMFWFWHGQVGDIRFDEKSFSGSRIGDLGLIGTY